MRYIILVLSAFLALSCSRSASMPTRTEEPAKPMPTTPRPIRVVEPTPGNINALPLYLETVLPPEAKSTVEIFENSNVATFFTLSETFMPNIAARKHARDFIFAAYATGLPITSAQIVMYQTDGTLGLSVTLGARVASNQPPDTWTDKGVGPTIFLDWMKKQMVTAGNRRGADRADIGGPWAN